MICLGGGGGGGTLASWRILRSISRTPAVRSLATMLNSDQATTMPLIQRNIVIEGPEKRLERSAPNGSIYPSAGRVNQVDSRRIPGIQAWPRR